MNLGLVLTDERLCADLVGLASAALERSWPVRCFLTDRGVLALNDPAFKELVDSGRLPTALCELSVERHHDALSGTSLDDGPVVVGGQYQDAELVKNSDRTVVL